MQLAAFQGLIPRADLAAQVAAVPYDVVNTAEARALAEGNPYNLLHVDRAEIDLPDSTDPYSDVVYATAAANLNKLIADGILVRESGPCIYLYQQEMNGRKQTGVLAACSVKDYDEDIIKKHEKTRKVKEDDRTKLVDTLCAHTGPIFLTFKDDAHIQQLIDTTLATPAVFDFTADDGVAHRVWRVADAAAYVDAFAQVPFSYVADGHHRSASASRVGRERAEANPNHNGSEAYNWFLGVLFPASHLAILPYNRLVTDLNGLSVVELLEKISDQFSIVPTENPSPAAPGNMCMYVQGQWHHISWNTAEVTGPVNSLDVKVLEDRILNPLLGIEDLRVSNRIDFVGGIRGTAELERRVDSGEMAVAFSMYPTTVAQLMDIADAGEIMPPKSTWFEPKLRSGLVVQTFEPK